MYLIILSIWEIGKYRRFVQKEVKAGKNVLKDPIVSIDTQMLPKCSVKDSPSEAGRIQEEW